MSKHSDLLWIFIAISFLFALGLGSHAYLVPSEARYIEIPRQMLITGDWLTPRINGVPYFEKPPLFYWMQAAALGLFGMDEWAGRITTALLMTLTCLLAFANGCMLYSRRAGLLAALMLATSLMGYALAHVAMLDVPVAFFITLMLTCFIAAQKTQNRHYYLLMYAASALAVMSKGLIGMVIPGLVIGGWIIISNQWKILKEARLITGLCVFLLIAAPWHILMARAHPDFLSFYFIHEHFTRFLTTEHKRTAPWWFFIAITAVGILPWLGLLPSALRRLNTKNAMDLFLLLWILLPLLFFSASSSKLLSYIFPIFPPLAVLLGRELDNIWQGNTSAKNLKISAVVLVVILVSALIATQLLPEMPGKTGRKMAMLTAISLPQLLPILLAVIGLGFVILKKRSIRAHIAALALTGISIGLTANYVIAPLDVSGTKPLSVALNQYLQPDDLVVAYGRYWQDLPVYLNRNIIVVNWQGELSFGVERYVYTQEWMIKSDRFWQMCAHAKAGVYVFIHENDLKNLPDYPDCTLHITAQYGKTLLLEKAL
jgi:4-amino-4-deoxy-L-arabinose transferase-like glycosyltransferase